MRKRRWYEYALMLVSFLLAFTFLAAGGTKLIADQTHVNNFARWGYPYWFMYVTGGVEVVTGILLLVPITRFYGAMLALLTMGGAIITHVQVGEWLELSTPLLLAGLAVVAAISQLFFGR